MPGEDFIQSQTCATPQTCVTHLAVVTTVNGAANSASQTLASTTGLQPGDRIYFATTGAERTILTVDSGTTITLTATISTTNGEAVRKRIYVDDIENIGSIRIKSDSTSTSTELFLVLPSDLTILYGRTWFIYADEAVEPIIVAIDGGTSINAQSNVTLSTTFGAIAIQATTYGGWIAWVLTPAT